MPRSLTNGDRYAYYSSGGHVQQENLCGYRTETTWETSILPIHFFFPVVVGLQDEVCFQEDILHWVFVEEMKARLPRLRASEEPQALKESEQKIWVWGCPNKTNK